MAADHDESTPSDVELRVRAIESVLVEKGYVEAAALDHIVEAHETSIGPHIGARAVARAWVDPDYRQALFADASAAIAPFVHLGRVGDQLIAVENTPDVHNMVVCTLCSCYPWDVLGLPPVWYKSPAYRSRAVKEPRSRARAADCLPPKTSRTNDRRQTRCTSSTFQAGWSTASSSTAAPTARCTPRKSTPGAARR